MRHAPYRSALESSEPLSNDQLQRIAPSIFTQTAHDSRSDRYSHIPTVTVLDKLRDNGFQPVKVMAARVRDGSRLGFEKHLIRMRHADGGMIGGGVYPEVVLVNSHDGSSSYSLMAGVFRTICANGMISGDYDSLRVRHTGRVVDEVLEGSFAVLEQSKRALGAADKWQQIQLSADDQNALAIAAHHVRFADPAGNIDTPIQPAQLLRPRRSADLANDLWTTFNRVQENVIRGGLHARAVEPSGRRGRMVSTREVKGIDGNVNLNKALWKLAEALAGHKAN